MNIAILKALCEVKRLWIVGCNFDGLNPENNFVVWSKENPFKDSYNEAIGNYIEKLHEDMERKKQNAFKA